MNINWNASDYTENFSFVYKYGEAVTELINAPKGAFVADLGCGSGALTKQLADKGYRAMGIDASEAMLKQAKTAHPQIPFIQGDALTFKLDEKADVIFSNAVFHWIDENKQEQLVKNIADNIKQGGLLVCEFGGRGCAETVHSALEKAFERRGLSYPRVFYFPTIGEYAPILEKYGLKVTFASLFDRPTPQQTENGLRDWIKMFDKKPFESLSEALTEEIINEVCRELKPKLYINGKWIVDYVRIRLKAEKI